MLYFSQLYGKHVIDEAGENLGVLKDFLFLPLDAPVVTKFVVTDKSHKDQVFSIKQLKKINGKIYTTASPTSEEKISDKEVSVAKNLQDKQIMDLVGAKVIRANDVVIQESPSYTISGIDIGILGVLRWVKLEHLVTQTLRKLGIHYKSKFLAWDAIQPLEVTQGKIILKQEKEKMEKLQPEDLADYLEKTTIVNSLKVLKLMDSELAAQVIADINSGYQTQLFREFSPEKAGHVLSLMDADEAVDVLLTLSKERQEKILPHIDPVSAKHILHLLAHAKTPIGHLMSSDFLSVSVDTTVKHIMARVKRETEDFSDLPYIYGVNKNGQIVGVIGLHQLFLYSPETELYKIMEQNLVLARLTTPKEIAVKKLLKYHLACLPVVDEEKKILGIVKLEDVAEDLLDRVVKE